MGKLQCSALCLSFGAMSLFGQNSGDATRPSFEVISIKPTPGNPVNSGFRRANGGSLNATNVTVRFLIEFAYDVRDDQISGGPAWLDSARFEVVAKPGEGAEAGNTQQLVRQRTQSLLADRFHLAFHRETKELPVLVLKVAKNGPKGLKPSVAASMDYVTNGHHLDCQHVSMATFAGFLAHQTHRSVTDKTGITGDFDFTLDWTPDDAPAGAAAEGGAVAPQFPPFFLALQEQLGMRLEQQKGPVEVLTIDRAERPAEN
jgi:bla regulator protein BlaR1